MATSYSRSGYFCDRYLVYYVFKIVDGMNPCTNSSCVY